MEIYNNCININICIYIYIQIDRNIQRDPPEMRTVRVVLTPSTGSERKPNSEPITVKSHSDLSIYQTAEHPPNLLLSTSIPCLGHTAMEKAMTSFTRSQLEYGAPSFDCRRHSILLHFNHSSIIWSLLTKEEK